MVSSSKIESLATRYAPYIDELRDFFRSRNVPFGGLADLQAFPDRLADPSFCEEMVSMTRSILYQESEVLPRTELMEVIAIAVGGSALDDPKQDVHNALRQILSFVTDAVRSQRSTSQADASDAMAGMDASARNLPPELTAGQILRVPANTFNGISAPVPPHAEPRVPVQPAATNDRLSRALLDGNAQPSPAERDAPPAAATQQFSASPEDLAGTVQWREVAHIDREHPSVVNASERANTEPSTSSGPVPLPSAEPIVAETVAPSLPEPPAHLRAQPIPSAPSAAARPRPQSSVQARTGASRSPESFFRRAYWIPGVCALLLAAVAIWFLQTPSQSKRSNPPAPIRTSAPLAASAPKPSAYGAPIGGKYPGTAGSTEKMSTPASDAMETASPARAAGTEAAVPEQRASSRLRLTPLASANLLGGREGVFLASSGMMASHLISAPAPGYPKLASFAHVEGAVIVQVVVGRSGKVEATRVLDGPHLLRGAAEHAIRRWRYRPYMVDGKPTDVATIVTVSFRMRK